MSTLRRKVLAGIGAIAAGIGGVWAFFNDNDSDNGTLYGTAGNNTTSNTPSSETNTSQDDESNTSDTTNESGTGNGTETEYEDAQTPPADPEIETNKSVIDRNATAVEPPSPEDVTLSNTELITGPHAATFTGTATNEADVSLTIDIEVQFFAEGQKIGRPALGGTTGLKPGKKWDFSITAQGSEFSEATDCEVMAHIQQSISSR